MKIDFHIVIQINTINPQIDTCYKLHVLLHFAESFSHFIRWLLDLNIVYQSWLFIATSFRYCS